MILIKKIKKDEFKNLRKENDTIKIIGETKLSKWNEKKHANKTGYEQLSIPNDEKTYLVKQRVFGPIKEYIQVCEDEYIAVKHSLLIPFIIIIAIVTIVAVMLLGNYGEDTKFPNIQLGGQDIEDYDPTYDTEQEMIEVPGLSQQYVLDEKNKELYLVNPKGNSVHFKYIISTEDGKVLYETKYIPANKMEKANLYDLLTSGEHKILVTVQTVDATTNVECNSAQMETTLIVKK